MSLFKIFSYLAPIQHAEMRIEFLNNNMIIVTKSQKNSRHKKFSTAMIEKNIIKTNYIEDNLYLCIKYLKRALKIAIKKK